MPYETTWAPRTGEGTFKGRNDEIFDNPPQEIQIPGRFFPQANFKDALWITLQARELVGISTGGRGGQLKLGRTKTKFKFMAPPEILEMHNHDWTEFASLSSRLLEKILQAKNLAQHGKALYEQVPGLAKKVLQGNLSLNGILQSVESAATSVNLNVPQRKIDTPLAYTNSQRRQLQMEFILADNVGGRDVVKTVKLLQSFAAARNNSAIGISFPHIFKIASEPEGLLLMEHSAITSVQPTWLYPYVDGYPTRCNLTISVTDMSPLFQKTITEGTIINVHPGEDDLTPSYDEQKGVYDPRAYGSRNSYNPLSIPAASRGGR